MNDLLDDNNFFIFDDVNVRISPVSKMPFRKKPRDSMHVRSKSNTNKSLPRIVHKWLPKLQPLAEPVAKWFPKVDIMRGASSPSMMIIVDEVLSSLLGVLGAAELVDTSLGLPNEIYSLIDSNETAKDLWDALEKQMRGSEYGEQDRKAAILYEYETFKATDGEQLLDTYLHPLALVAEKTKVSKRKEKVVSSDSEGSGADDFSELKKITALLAKAFNRRKFYSKPTNNNLRTSSTSQSANKKQEFVKSDDKKVKKKDDEKKKDILPKTARKQRSKTTTTIRQNESSLSAEETIAEVAYYTSEFESESEFETSEYYDNSTNYGLFMNNDDDQEIFHDAIKSASENFIKNHLDSQKDYNKSEVDHNDSEEKEHLVDKLIQKFNHKIDKCQKRIEKANQQTKDLENQNKDLQDKYDVLINQVNTFEEQNNEFNEQIKVLKEKNADLLAQTEVLQDQLKEIGEQEILFDKMSCQLVEMNNNVLGLQEKILEKETKILELEGCRVTRMLKLKSFENPSYFEKAKDLRPSLYDEKVIGLGYTLMFLIHSDEALEIKKFKRARENKIEFSYDYGNLNASYVNEKINFSDDYFQEIINLDFEKIDSPFQQTSSLKSYVPTVILEKIIIDLEDEVVSLLEKEKANLKTIESLKLKGFESSENAIFESENQSEKECDQVENSKVIAPAMFKLSVSQSVSSIPMSKTSCDYKKVENKTKRKRRKRKSSKQNDKQVNNDVSRANSDFVHFSDLDIFSSVRRRGVIWKQKRSSNTSNVDLSSISHLKLNKDVKRYSRKDLLSCNNSHLGETSSAYVCNDVMNVSCNHRLCDLFDENNQFIFDDESVRISPVSKMPFRWLLKMQPLPEPVAKWFPRIVQICLWIIDLGCSKHMTGNSALLTNFVEKFLGAVPFGNNDFTVIVGYGDVGLEVAFRKSTCFVRKEDGVDLLTGDRSSNFYTISLNKVSSNSSTCLLAKASFSQSWLWHQRLLHLNFATINNLVKKNIVQGLPKMKFEKDHLCSACEQGKIHRIHHKSKTAFASNKPLYLLHMDLCGSMRIENEASEVIISFIKKTQVNLQLQVQRVQTDNGMEFKNKTLAKFFDEVGTTQQISAARTPQQNGVVERRNRTLVEAARTKLTFANLPLFL
nr:hypothetical protein [Tanacetum cinerariifolium]